ncbi:MAG: hypothetical protein Q9167_005474 [Letrouitia subvulpina]
MHSLIAFIKQDLNKNMNAFFPGMHQEVRATIEERLGHSQGHIDGSFPNYVRVLIWDLIYAEMQNGSNEAAMEYSSSAVGAAVALMKWPPWVRPFVAPFVKELQDLSRHFSTMEGLLRPVVNARIQAIQDGRNEKPHDFIQWWIENMDGIFVDTKAMTTSLVGLNFAGIRSTGMVLMQALFDLASRHEYVTPLCEEVEKVIAEEGTEDLDPRAMGKLKLMDSFLKESQRHVAQNIPVSVYRKVLSPLTLKDGTILPTGSYVCVPSIDPAVDPKSLTRKFDGFRWARMRKGTSNDTKYLSVATGLDSLEFGYGSHACPGRFFAMNAIKAVLAPILLNYDLRLKDGDDRPRPRYNRIGVLMPDMDRVVEFRRRKRGT